MKKCDVIIPVYNAHEWLEKCINALLCDKNMEVINKIILVDDGSNEDTKRLIQSYQHPVCIDNSKFLLKCVNILENEQNEGFVKTVNRGIKYCLDNSDAEFCLLLNSDCLVAHATLPKMISHMEKSEKVAVLCPLGCNMDSLSIKCFKGFDYLKMDKLFENRFAGQQGEARAVFGNCMMIPYDVFREIGLFDEVYGRGYCEEVDFQYRAMEKGYNIRVAMDCYVFHKAHASFGKSKELSIEKRANMEIFLSRYEDAYMRRTSQLMNSNVVLKVKSALRHSDRKLPIKSGVAKSLPMKKVGLILVNYLDMAWYVLSHYGIGMMFKSFGKYVCSLFSKKV